MAYLGGNIYPVAVEILKGTSNETLMIFTDRHGKTVVHLASEMAIDTLTKLEKAVRK